MFSFTRTIIRFIPTLILAVLMLYFFNAAKDSIVLAFENIQNNLFIPALLAGILAFISVAIALILLFVVINMFANNGGTEWTRLE